MSDAFPEPVTNLALADVPLEGVRAFLSQAEKHQVLFMEFDKDVEMPEHAHKSQWGVVLAGKIDLVIDGVKRTCVKGDRYFIPEGVRHSASIYAGYADITFFDQENRYRAKPS